MSNNIYVKRKVLKMVRYSDELIEEIKSSNDIVDIISQYVVLKRRGRNFLGLCPFHKEKTPSFSVSPDKQIFHCFGCGVGGDVITFINKIENLNYRESLETLAEKAGITLPTADNSQDSKRQILKSKVYEINELVARMYHENLYKPQAKLAQEYVKKRKLDNNTLKKFMIGYANGGTEVYQMLKSKGFTDEEILASNLVKKFSNGYVDVFKNRLMFPIQDIKNKFIAFGGRVLDDSKPKYINSPEGVVYSKGRNLYALNVAKNSGENNLIIVEGYMDAVSLHQRGIPNAVASLGTALTEMQGRLLRKYSEKIIISYDSDGAGQAATLRGLDILTNMGCDVRILQMEGAKDPDEYVIKYGNGRFKLLVNNAISLIEFKAKVLKKSLDLQNANDKIKFLKEIAKLLTSVNSKIEQEIYLGNIAREYGISKEAIYAEINKLSGKTVDSKILSKQPISKVNKEDVEKKLIEREKSVIAVLINEKEEGYNQIKQEVSVEDLQSEPNRKILKKLYEEFEKGNSNNISNTLMNFFAEDEKVISRLTELLSEEYQTNNDKKLIDNIIKTYKKEKLNMKKQELIEKQKSTNLTVEEIKKIDREIQEVIIELAKIK